MNPKSCLAAVALLTAGMAQATCYSVYKADGTLLQQSSATPVDLTEPIGDTVTAKFGPGASMTVSDLAIYCRDKREVHAGPKSLAVAVRQENEKSAGVGRKKNAEAAEATTAAR
jgi:hypothetical protein